MKRENSEEVANGVEYLFTFQAAESEGTIGSLADGGDEEKPSLNIETSPTNSQLWESREINTETRENKKTPLIDYLSQPQGSSKRKSSLCRVQYVIGN